MKLDCGEVEIKDPIACEGKNITLKCPKDKPWMKITSATFGRRMSEARLCPIPKNSSYKKWNSEQCSEDMTTKVAEICADQVPCVLNVNTVTFHDPCPHLYKYMWFLYECSCRPRQVTRDKRATSICIPRKPNTTSSSYTTIQPTPMYTTMRQSMSQNVTNSTTYAPIRMTVRPTKSILVLPIKTNILEKSLTIKTTILVNSYANNTLAVKRVGERKKAFFLLLELFAIYHEAANEDPPMALMWSFIGILLGLFIITITFLTMGLRKKPRNKKLFRLSELETEEGEIQSPTIHRNSQFPDSSDLESRQAAVAKFKAKRENGKAVSKHFPGMGSWSDLLKTDTSLYINPLWRGWREEYLSLTAQGEEAELDIAQGERQGLTRSEPWNLGGTVPSDDLDHRDGHRAGQNTSAGNGTNNGNGNSDVNGTNDGNVTSDGNGANDGNNTSDSDGASDGNGCSVDSSNSENDSQQNSGGDKLNDNNTDLERSKPSTSKNESAPVTTNKKQSATESSPSNLTSIPVGIPSHPVPDPKIFHTEPTRTKKPENREATSEVDNPKEQKAGKEKNHLNKGTPTSSTNDHKNPSNNLLSKFGISSDDAAPTLKVSNTALSSPCLLGDENNQPEDHESSHPLETNPGLQVLSRSIRSRSLDSYTPGETVTLHNPSNRPPRNSATTNNPPSQNSTTHKPTVTQSTRLSFVRNKNNPSLWPKVLVDDKQNEQAHNLPATNRQSKNWPDSRASSGYYSNNTSPLVEYPADLKNSQNSDKKAEQKFPEQQSLQRQTSSNSDDDLPPLPPPLPPLIPISPLPHMCVSGYRDRKTKDENNLEKNPSRPAVRKVHFKSSE